MYLKIECVYFMNCRKKILSFAFFMNIAAQCFFGKLKKEQIKQRTMIMMIVRWW